VKQALFLAAAREEFLAEVAYYNAAQTGLGLRFAASIEAATALALTFPLSGTPAAAETRRMIVRGFPYSVFYRPQEDAIVVFAIAHHARRPGYWAGRSPNA